MSHKFHLLHRFNNHENKNNYIENLNNIEYVSSLTNEKINKKVKVGCKIFLLGSRKLKEKGFLAVYKVKSIKLKACDNNSDEVDIFTNEVQEKRQKLQWRIKVKLYKIYESNNIKPELKKLQKLTVITDELCAELLEELEDYERN